jgi:hypothetical protein
MAEAAAPIHRRVRAEARRCGLAGRAAASSSPSNNQASIQLLVLRHPLFMLVYSEIAPATRHRVRLAGEENAP